MKKLFTVALDLISTSAVEANKKQCSPKKRFFALM